MKFEHCQENDHLVKVQTRGFSTRTQASRLRLRGYGVILVHFGGESGVNGISGRDVMERVGDQERSWGSPHLLLLTRVISLELSVVLAQIPPRAALLVTPSLSTALVCQAPHLAVPAHSTDPCCKSQYIQIN